MAKCKFKVGDKVIPTKDNNYTITGQDMELGVVIYVGKCGAFDDDDMRVKILKHKDKVYVGGTLSVQSRFFKKIGNETIVIYRDDNEVTALDKSTGKKAIARCIDFHIGAKLAFSRLMGEPEENQQNKLKIMKCDRYEVGDKVFIRDWDDMEREFGIGGADGINCECGFTKGMKKFCNTVVEIVRVTASSHYRIKKEGEFRTFTNDMIAGKVVNEPESSKPEFVPHLEGYPDPRFYGKIGDETPLKDVIGRALRVGDTVELYGSDNNYRGERAIVKDVNKASVMGIRVDCREDGTIDCGWKIILKRKFEDIPDGETVGAITYVKKERV